MTPQQISAIEALKASFVHMDEIIDMIITAYIQNLRAGKARFNIILQGPPGHGKSDIAKLLGEILCPGKVMVYAMTGETTPAQFLGDYDFEALIKRNELRLNTDKSPVSAQVAVLEEMLDAPGLTLKSLKQIVMSGVYCDGMVCTPNATQLFIACTNVPTSTLEGSDTEMAVLERFVYRTEVKWPSYNIEDYLECYMRQIKPTDVAVQSLLQTYAQFTFYLNNLRGKIITPRTAMSMITLLGEAPNADVLRGFDGIQGEIFEQAKEELERLLAGDNNDYVVSQLRARVFAIMQKIRNAPSAPLSLTDMYELHKLIQDTQKELRNIKVDSEYESTYKKYTETTAMVTNCDNVLGRMIEREEKQVTNVLE